MEKQIGWSEEGTTGRVARAAEALGWGTAGVARSPLPGPSGNVEFFLWLRTDAAPADPAAIEAVVEEGRE